MIYPLYAVMFAERRIATPQIAVLLFVWSFVAFTLEVPTGALADRFSRRHVLAVAQLLRAVAFLVWWHFPSFTGYLIGFVLWGIKSALTSGAFQALVYDELYEQGQSDQYAQVMGRAASFSLAAQVLVGVLAALVVRHGFNVLLLLSALACVVGSVVVLSFPKARAVKEPIQHSYLHLLREGIHEVVHNPAIRRLVLFSGAVLGFGAVDEFLGLVLRDVGISNSGISVWHAVFFAAGILGSLLAHRSLRLRDRGLSLAALAWGLSLLVASSFGGRLIVLPLIVFSGLFYFQQVALDARLQSLITSKARATITSVQGVTAELAALTTFLAFGGLAGVTSNHAAVGVVGAAIVAVTVLFAVTWKASTA